MTSKGLRRVNQEIRKYVQNPIDGVRLIAEWTTTKECCFELDGPEKTPYEDGVFKLKLVFEDDYPTRPPKGHFLTRIFHPNISSSGEVCVNVLSRDWNPELGLSHVLMVIRCLLIQPFAESALDEIAGMMLLRSYDEYFQHAQLFTSIHAKKRRKRSQGEVNSPTKEESPLAPVSLTNQQDSQESNQLLIKTKVQRPAKPRTGLRRL